VHPDVVVGVGDCEASQCCVVVSLVLKRDEALK
jgi:hypothetical protein